MTTRKAIRDAVGAAIAQDTAVSVFIGEHIAWAADTLPAAYVAFTTGTFERDLVNPAMAQAEVAITFAATGGQDAVDLIADAALVNVFDDATVIATVESAYQQDFTYEADPETGISYLTTPLIIRYKP